MTIEEIGKKMPFREEKDYVPQLLALSTESALHAGRTVIARRSPLRIVAMLAVLLTVGGAGWLMLHQHEDQQPPLDTFLDNMSDEDLVLLKDYCDEEMLASDWEWDL